MLWGNWVLLNCAAKLLIFAFDVDSKILSGLAAVSSPDRHRRVATEEDATPLTDTAICVMSTGSGSLQPSSLFTPGVTWPWVHPGSSGARR